MKTKEELAGLKEEMSRLDAELTQLSEEELKEVAAGTAFTAGTYAFTVMVHNNCGGLLVNVGNPFASCYCDRCGEKHYWHFSFDYTEMDFDEWEKSQS